MPEETGLFSSPFETEKSTIPAKKEPSPYAKELAARENWPLEQVQKMEKRGFGRTEMVSFIAIARRSPKKWDELVKEREKGATLRQMARDAGLDYDELFSRSMKIREEIVRKLETEKTKAESSAEGTK